MSHDEPTTHANATQPDVTRAGIRGVGVALVILCLGTLALVFHFGFDSRLGGAALAWWLLAGPVVVLVCTRVSAWTAARAAGEGERAGHTPPHPPRVGPRRTGAALMLGAGTIVVMYAFIVFWGMLAVTSILYFSGAGGPTSAAIAAVRITAALLALLSGRTVYRRVLRRPRSGTSLLPAGSGGNRRA